MGNTITNDCYPDRPALHMSNGLTELFFDALAMSTSLLAVAPWEVRVARWMCEQDQNAPVSMGRGWVGFDLDDLGWTAEDWQNQRGFLLRAIGFARAAARWLLPAEVNFEFVGDALTDFFVMVDGVDSRILGPRASQWPRGDDTFWRGPPPSDDGHCPIHGCYLHAFGCIVCHSFDDAAGEAWRDGADGEVGIEPPWQVAARTPIPVRRFVRMMTRRSFEPSILAALRPKPAPWAAAYKHVLSAFAADPFDLIATTGDAYAYELEARHYLAEWASGRALTPAELLGAILTTSFASAPRFTGRLGQVLRGLERLDESLIGLVPRTPPAQVRSTLWPRTPEHAQLARLVPPRPSKGSLALGSGVVFPEIGEELIGFIRVGDDWMSHVYLGPPDAAARVSVRIERPLEWVSTGYGDQHLAYPGSGVQLVSQRTTLVAVRPWFQQSHLHLVLLGPGDRVLRVFQLAVVPEANPHTADDPSGQAQLAALRDGRIDGGAKTMVEIAAGRVDHTTNPAANILQRRLTREATVKSKRVFLKDAVPQVFVDLLARLDLCLDEGRLDEVAALAELLTERLGPDILAKLVAAHGELRGGPNRHTHALALLFGLVDPSDQAN